MNQKNRLKRPGQDQIISRRGLFKMAAGAAALTLPSCATTDEPRVQRITSKGNIDHSVAFWCFEESKQKSNWTLNFTCRVANHFDCKSVELLGPSDFPLLKRYGLVCAITMCGMPDNAPFEQGWNNKTYHDELISRTKAAIDATSAAEFPNVIAFTGLRENIPDDVGAENCVTGLKKVIGYAEKKKVSICLEMLNSRVAEEMKGHPGYQGDHTDYCMEIIKKVGSPRMKLLFDIYHVQIMDGDIITRIRQYKDYIGHYHTAGVPGRCELDGRQEINYKPIMKAIAETGYNGFVGHEFIPTGDPVDPLQSLRDAIALCDV